MIPVGPPRLTHCQFAAQEEDQSGLTLKLALFPLGITRERGLRFLTIESIYDLPVCNVAHLVILVHKQTISVADTIFSLGHKRITGLVCLAHIAIYAFPTLVTITFASYSWCPIAAIGQGATERLRAVHAPKTCWTRTSPARFGTVGELVTLEVFEIAIEAWRTAIGSVLKDDERIPIVETGIVLMRLVCRSRGENTCEGHQGHQPRRRAHD